MDKPRTVFEPDSDHVSNFNSLLRKHDEEGARRYLYENRNTMTRDDFENCIVDYGHYVYEEG